MDRNPDKERAKIVSLSESLNPGMHRGLSGQYFRWPTEDSGLSPDLQNSPDSDFLLVDMGLDELDSFFDSLIRLVEHEGSVN